MKIAVIGSRTFLNYIFLKSILDIAVKYNVLEEIVSGGAKGADFLAKKYAIENNIKYKEFPAQWDIYGKRAGFLRNKMIIDYCDIVIAFWDGESNGTRNSIDLAKKQNKKVFIYLPKSFV